MRNEVLMRAIEDNGMDAAIGALGKSIARWTDKEYRLTTAIPGLFLFRHDEPTGPMSGMYEPSICLVAQGAKRVLLGEETYVYDAGGAEGTLVTSANLHQLTIRHCDHQTQAGGVAE